MGAVYDGPYAEIIDADAHEGYTAQVLLDGTLAGAYTAEADALLPSCSCGWHGQVRYPPTDAGEAEALAEWDRDHLRPRIAAAARSWPAWSRHLARRAEVVTRHIAAGDYHAAALVLDALTADLAARRRLARRLADHSDDRAASDDRVGEGTGERGGR
jgi:hypothetical protein